MTCVRTRCGHISSRVCPITSEARPFSFLKPNSPLSSGNRSGKRGRHEQVFQPRQSRQRINSPSRLGILEPMRPFFSTPSATQEREIFNAGGRAMKTKSLPLSAIHADAGLNPREKINFETVSEYSDAMRSGATFPPLVVFFDGKIYWLADGFHRLESAKHTKRAKIDCDVRIGERSDALHFALSANVAHGLRRTNADKRRSAELALAAWSEKSDRAIADICAVSFALVADVRRASQVQESCTSKAENPSKSQISTPPPRRKGKDGKHYSVPVRKPVSSTPPRKTAPPATMDATGIEVPPEILPLWNSAFERGQRLLTIISEARREIRAAQDSNDPVFREVDHTDILAKLDNIYADLKRAKPFAVCPDCSGVMAKGCPTCKGRGFVSDFYWTHCISEEKRKLRNAKESEAA